MPMRDRLRVSGFVQFLHVTGAGVRPWVHASDLSDLRLEPVIARQTEGKSN